MGERVIPFAMGRKVVVVVKEGYPGKLSLDCLMHSLLLLQE